jgi:hypothetical protein
VKPRQLIFACIFLLLSATLALAQNPVPFVNQPLVPASAVPGGPGFTLTVNGTGFVSGSTVNWNGTALTTTLVSNSQLTATVPAANVAAAGTASVTVTNPGPGAGTSAVVYFPVATSESSVSLFSVPVATGSYGFYAPLVGDFNGDGIPDLIGGPQVINGPVTLAIVFGNGDGTFQPPLAITPTTEGSSLLVGDFNNDGKLDFLVASSTLIQIFLGNGDGTFTAVNTDLSGFTSLLQNVIVGDFNGDGKLDVACLFENTGAPNAIEVLLGKGDGTFQPPIQSLTAPPGLGVPQSEPPRPVVVGDFNGDNIPDLVVATDGTDINGFQPGSIQIMLGNGDGSFRQGSLYVDFARPAAAADFNGDGKLDLAVNGAGVQFQVLIGNGDGTFQAPVEGFYTRFGPQAMYVADFNGDGKVDVSVLTGIVGEGVIGAQVVNFYGNGDGTFQESPATGQLLNNFFGSFAVADFNGDGRLDLATSQFDATTGFILFLQGTVPVPHLSTTLVNFGQQTVGTASPPQTVVLTDTGNAPLLISSITVTGANAADYGQTNTCGASLASGASCQINVTLTPGGPSARVASINILDNAPGGGSQSVQLSGTGIINFTLGAGTGSPTSITVSPGGTATFNLAVAASTGWSGTATVALWGTRGFHLLGAQQGDGHRFFLDHGHRHRYDRPGVGDSDTAEIVKSRRYVGSMVRDFRFVRIGSVKRCRQLLPQTKGTASLRNCISLHAFLRSHHACVWRRCQQQRGHRRNASRHLQSNSEGCCYLGLNHNDSVNDPYIDGGVESHSFHALHWKHAFEHIQDLPPAISVS